MIREREYAAMSGWAALAVLVAAAAVSLWQMVENIKVDNDGLIAAWAMGGAERPPVMMTWKCRGPASAANT